MERLGGNHFTRLALCVFLIIPPSQKKKEKFEFCEWERKKTSDPPDKKNKKQKNRAGNV
jgi:hypothetical protein